MNSSSASLKTDPAAGTGTRRRLALVTLCLAVLVVQLDTSVVYLAIQPIGAAFGTGVGSLQWVIDSYNLTYAIFLLTGGLLADMLGRRLVFMAGAAVFAVASAACALAPDIITLIGARMVTGLGAALVLPASLAIIRVLWTEPADRGRALGIWAGCNGLAFAIGPALGGVLVDTFGWRSIFMIVVPFAVAAIALALLVLSETSDPQERRFDAAAQVLAILALGGLTLATIQSHEGGAILPIAALGVAAMSLIGFVRIEAARGASALVPLDMFRIRAFSGAVCATGAMTFGMYGALFLVPLTWQATGQLEPVSAGIALMPMALVFVAVSPFSGVATERFGQRSTIAGGLAVIGMGVLTIGAFAKPGSFVSTEIGLVLTGLGMGMATGPLMAAAVGAVSSARSGTASSLINVARMVGATIGVAVLGAVFVLCGGAHAGLRGAMLAGGATQLAGAATAWLTLRPAGKSV